MAGAIRSGPYEMKTIASPLSKRVKQLFLRFYFISISLILLITWQLVEGLEETIMEIDKQAEIEHFLNRHETDKVVQVQSAMLTMAYLPTDRSAVENLPIIFSNLPVPFEGEVKFFGKEYLVIINQAPEGTYYIARDLSRLEAYESWIISVLATLAGLAAMFGLVFSELISRRIAQPIQALADDLKQIEQGRRETYLRVAYRDTELNEISCALRSYLEEIDQLIDRERSLLSMASHELRTPIAVILGAAEVIEHRGKINVDDLKTLRRIIASANIMSANVNVLLDIVRQKKGRLAEDNFSLGALAEEVVSDIKISDPVAAQRVEIFIDQSVTVYSNKSMVRILLNNLVSNGLSHNQGRVSINVTKQYFEVKDQGIKSSMPQTGSMVVGTSGLGLYIVTLICEHLGWQFSLETLANGTSRARVLIDPNQAKGVGLM